MTKSSIVLWMLIDMTFDDTLRDGSSPGFGKLPLQYMQIHAIKTSHFHFHW